MVRQMAATTYDAGAAQVAGGMKSRAISGIHAAVDCIFLSAVTVASLVLYVGQLGFYYDDYSLLDRMDASHDQSLLGLYHAVRPALGQRPLAAAMFAVLYRLFGPHPLGYHIVNACLLVAIAILLYLVLRELRLPRLVAVAVPLVYSTLPHYSTERFWPDVLTVNLSSAFYLLSLYAGLRAVRALLPGVGLWLAIAVVGVGVSMFTYELFAPLFVLNVVLVWWAARRLRETTSSPQIAFVASGALVTAIIATGVAKVIGVAEHGQNGYDVGLHHGALHHLAYLVSGVIKLNVGTYLLAFPYVIWWIFRHHFSVANAGIAGISGLLAFVYLWRIGRRDRDTFGTSGPWRALIGFGLLTFVLGYAIFLTTESVLFRSAGIDNRVNAGAALGVAGVLIGVIGWLAGRLGAKSGLIAFSAATASVVASGVLVVDTLGSFWTSAAKRQHAIVTGVMHDAGALPASATVILDGACPEIGPAVVFAGEWDLRGALRVAYRDPSLKADVASEALRAGPRGLALDETLLGRVSTRTYPYGRGLIIYDFTSGRLYHLLDRTRAARYLARSRPSFHCPPQRSFAWGFDPSRRWSLL
jgi:hypothetical protein